MNTSRQPIKMPVLAHLVAQAIYDSGPLGIPESILYASVSSAITSDGWDYLVRMLIYTNPVERQGDSLVWVGP